MKRLRRYQPRVKQKLQRSQPGDGLASRMPRKGGRIDEVRDEWRRECLEVMEENGITNVEVAKAVGVHKSSITVLFRMSDGKPPGPETSALAKPVADFLKVPLPNELSNEELRVLRHLRAVRRREESEYLRAVALLESISGLKPVSHKTKKSSK